MRKTRSVQEFPGDAVSRLRFKMFACQHGFQLTSSVARFQPAFRGLPARSVAGWCAMGLFLFPAAQLAAEVSKPRFGEGEPQSEYLIRIWQTEEGLPQNSVTSIAQTPDGYIWFGTFNGLVRFDGVRFTVFDSANTPELKSSRLVRLSVDRTGSLWMISEFGDLTRLANGKFKGFASAEGLPSGGASALSEDKNAKLWLSDPAGSIYGFEPDRFLPAPNLPGLTTNSFDTFLDDGEGTQWVIPHKRTIARFSGGQYVTLKDADAKQDLYVRASLRCRTGGLWITNGRVLRKFHRGQWEGPEWNYSAIRTSVFGMCEDREGNVWLGTFGQGLFRCAPSGAIQRFTTAEGLSHDVVRSICEDNEGNIWVGTDGGGLNRLKPRLFSVYDMGEGSGGNIVMSVTEDRDGNIWLGSNGGGLRYLTPHGIPITNHPCVVTNLYIWSVVADRDGHLWFGTWGDSLGLCHNQRVTYFAEKQANDKPLVLFEDRSGNLWAGGRNGLNRRGRAGLTVFTIQEGLCHNDVHALAEDSKGRLYVGTDGGLSILSEGRFVNYTRRNGLASDEIRALYVDKEDVVWIGTTAGLSQFKEGRVFNFKIAESSRTKFIGGILEDDSGYLWMVADLGVLRVSHTELNQLAAGRIRSVEWFNYSKSDGMASGECSSSGRSQPIACKAKDGRLWFATVKGVAVVDPRKIIVNRQPPPVFIEEILADNKVYAASLRDGSSARPLIASTPFVTLPAGTEQLELRYTGLSYGNPRRVRFKYRLDGLDHDWVDPDTRRAAYYTRPPPGQYLFRVIACNPDGVWNTKGASLAVIVLPYFWETWWFRILVAVATGGVGIMIYHRRIAQLEQRRIAQENFSRRLIESQEADRKRIAAELHDSLGQNLLVIKNRALLGLNQPPGHAGTAEQLREISSAASHAISEVRSIAHNLRPFQLDQLGLTRAIRATATQMARSSGINFTTDLKEIDHLLPPEFEINFFRIAQECMNNIVKHSGATEVKIALARGEQSVRLTVKDNGHGFDFEQARQANAGFGLSGLAERARLMGGKCEIKSAPGRGATVLIEIPVPPSAARNHEK